MPQRRFTLTIHGDVIDTIRERVICSIAHGWIHSKYYVSPTGNPNQWLSIPVDEINNPMAYCRHLKFERQVIQRIVMRAIPIQSWLSLTTANDPPETLDDLDLIPKNGKE
jgi:hypothetical protein